MSSLLSNIKPTKQGALPPPPNAPVAVALGVKDVSIEWLAGDGSDRCYYRIICDNDRNKTYVLMQLSNQDANLLEHDGYDWIKIAKILDRQRITVPKPVKSLPQFAALIIEDYGDRMLETIAFDLLHQKQRSELVSLYEQALGIIAKMIRIPSATTEIWCSRGFDEERYQWELDFFRKKFVGPVARWEFTKAEEAAFQKDCRMISAELAMYSRYFTHRDFHSRNIMVKNGRLAVIDFQDARLGSPAYDMVSLCFDSYVPFRDSERLQLMEDGMDIVRSQVSKTVREEINHHWRPMLLQRQLKAIGSFGFLTIDKNRGNYLKYVKPALETLDRPIVFDKRWPFLSGDLIERLKDLGPA